MAIHEGLRLALYARGADGNPEAAENQLEYLKSAAESSGGVVVKTYVDADRDQTAFKELMEDASRDEKEFDEVLVVAFSRVSRVPGIFWASLTKLRDQGITVRSLREGDAEAESASMMDFVRRLRDLLA